MAIESVNSLVASARQAEPTKQVFESSIDEDGILLSGEKVFWRTQPNGDVIKRRAWFITPFALVWTLFSLFWTVFAFIGVTSSVRHLMDALAYLFVLPGVVFVFIGWYMLRIPGIIVRESKSTHFLITNFRALIINKKTVNELRMRRWKGEKPGLFSTNSVDRETRPGSSGVISYWLDEMDEPQVKNRDGRFADLVFRKVIDSDGDEIWSGFDAIESADYALLSLENAIAKKEAGTRPRQKRTIDHEHVSLLRENFVPSIGATRESMFGRIVVVVLIGFMGTIGYCLFLQDGWKKCIRSSDRAIIQGDYVRAAQMSRVALEEIDRGPSISAPRTFKAHLLENLGISLLRTGKARLAIPYLQSAVEIRTEVINHPGEDERLDLQRNYRTKDYRLLNEAYALCK